MILFAWILCGFMAQAEKVAYPTQKILAKGIEELQIRGVNGRLKMTGRPEARSFRVKVRHTKNKTSQDWSLSVDRHGSALVFEVFSVAYGAQWRSHVQKDLWPDFDLEIEGPSRKATVSWREGDVNISNWSAPVEAAHLKGNLELKNMRSDFSVQSGEGRLVVDEMAGNLKIKGERGQLHVTKLIGNLDLVWLSGQMELKDLIGDGRIESNQGHLKLESCRGQWTIEMNNGQADIERCSGKLKAEGESTAWNLSRSPLKDAEIKSLSGPVKVNWKAGGAKVFLTSDNGPIKGRNVPSLSDAEGRSISEFKVGKKPYAQLFIRTRSGEIQFQQ